MFKVEKLQKKDAAEYQKLRNEIINVLEKSGGYEPAVDNLYIDRIASTAIYARKLETFLDSAQATARTYAQVTDTKLKLSKIIDDAMHHLALTRRDRISKQTESNFVNELKQALQKALEPANQP